MKILQIVGPSGSGKDFAFNTLSGKFPGNYVNVKFARSFKGVLEYIYGLEPGILDTSEGKSQPVPGMAGTSFLDVLIMAWSDSQKTIFGEIWLSISAMKIKEHFELGKTVVLTDLRQSYEKHLIHSYIQEGAEYACVLLEGRGKAQLSDAHSLEYAKFLCTVSGTQMISIDNSPENASNLDTFPWQDVHRLSRHRVG